MKVFDWQGEWVYREGEHRAPWDEGACDWASMGSFGEDLRMERLSRGIGLEEIAAETKISQRHLVALEQERFRLLPGGILSKGIVRGYIGALGLDQSDWMERFLRASSAAGEALEADRGWATFAANVGKARIQRHDAVEFRWRWLGAIVLMLAVAAGAFLTVRYFGVRAGWWPNVMPGHGVGELAHKTMQSAVATISHVLAWLRS